MVGETAIVNWRGDKLIELIGSDAHGGVQSCKERMDTTLAVYDNSLRSNYPTNIVCKYLSHPFHPFPT